MTVEQLLKPRIIVENNYPRSPYKHHEIICDPSDEQIEWAKEFTLNLRFLEWWEKRKEEDMPEYLNINGKIFKPFDLDKYYTPGRGYIFENKVAFNEGNYIQLKWCLPATEQEYLSYQSSLKSYP